MYNYYFFNVRYCQIFKATSGDNFYDIVTGKINYFLFSYYIYIIFFVAWNPTQDRIIPFFDSI